MKKTIMLAGVAAVLLSACATTPPSSSDSTEFALSAIRDAQVAGAETYAPQEYATANATFNKAKKLMLHKRSDRAQKLLQLSIAQADLAKAISEAEHAEATLSQLQPY
ncbi:MAG: DUF4398 domain-containing protein [Pseudomonadota bacterium]